MIIIFLKFLRVLVYDKKIGIHAMNSLDLKLRLTNCIKTVQVQNVAIKPKHVICGGNDRAPYRSSKFKPLSRKHYVQLDTIILSVFACIAIVLQV